MNEQQRFELSLLADGLGKVPPEKFQMEIWAKGTPEWDREGFDCDFAGCAIGWAPKFIPDLGLDYTKHFRDPLYRGRTGLHAISLYFGLPLEDSQFLFAPSAYRANLHPISPQTVAGRIRGYLDSFGRLNK